MLSGRMQPVLDYRSVRAVERIARRKRQRLHGDLLVGRQRFAANIPLLALRIAAYHLKCSRMRLQTMAGAGRQQQRIARRDPHEAPVGSADDHLDRTRRDAQHLVCGRMEMVIVENAVAPLRRLVITLEEDFEGGREVAAVGA